MGFKTWIGGWVPYSLEKEDELLVRCSSRPGMGFIAGWHGRVDWTQANNAIAAESLAVVKEEKTLTVRKEEIESKP